MDHSTLRNSTAEELALYLRAHATRSGCQVVTEGLLAGIEAESLPPGIYSIWLNACGDCSAVNEGLRQQFSIQVQRAASAKFGTLFTGPRVEEIWLAMGGTRGVVAYLSQASVRDYKLFCNEIRRTWNSRTAIEKRHQFVDELYKALCPQDYPEALIKIADERPLCGHNIIFPACSAELAAARIYGQPPSASAVRTAIKTHPAFFRQQYLAMLKDQRNELDIDWLTSLLAVSSGDTRLCKGEQLGVNIAFAIDVLDALAERDSIPIDLDTFHRTLANPLFKKLRRRSVKPVFVTQVVATYLTYVQKHGAGLGIKFPNAAVVEYVVRKYSRRPEQLETSLVDVLCLIRGARTVDTHTVEHLLMRSPWPRRLRLLELLVRNIPALGYDIHSDIDLKALPLSWSPKLFLLLPKREARALFERLASVKADPFGCEEVIQLHQIDHDPTYHILLLARDDPDLLDLATNAVEQRKREANKARKQPQRCFWARYALYCAAVSCSVELYRDTLKWARRYMKDPLTAVAIYNQGDLHSEASINLLCGFAAAGEKKSRDAVHLAIQQANGLCLDLFETACEAIAEPGFHSYQWKDVLGLMAVIVHGRLRRISELQDALSLTDEEVFDLVWRNTLEVCIKLEELGLDEVNSRLNFNTIGGPLSSIMQQDVRPRAASLRFFDELASRRNELWTAYRHAQRPATLVLPALYPRGLPFDCLIPLHMVKSANASSIK